MVARALPKPRLRPKRSWSNSDGEDQDHPDRSPIRRDKTQRATLVGLGLNKLHRTIEVEGTPEVLGQVRKVQHLVKVEEAA